jgi:hypothetical protein
MAAQKIGNVTNLSQGLILRRRLPFGGAPFTTNDDLAARLTVDPRKSVSDSELLSPHSQSKSLILNVKGAVAEWLKAMVC